MSPCLFHRLFRNSESLPPDSGQERHQQFRKSIGTARILEQNPGALGDQRVPVENSAEDRGLPHSRLCILVVPVKEAHEWGPMYNVDNVYILSRSATPATQYAAWCRVRALTLLWEEVEAKESGDVVSKALLFDRPIVP
ncbi:hypothetical protein Hypma_002647 [Hypsizygus marmoreus]|uniref:Uncharacterized protein n=1 Tax=Hypsizygus marmoreus TaxID=39966 RepID=A0A369J4A0_HYPMA|nr:hypothetical protein Hypma_002647 [Hypsizygus marmoreus]